MSYQNEKTPLVSIGVHHRSVLERQGNTNTNHVGTIITCLRLGGEKEGIVRATDGFTEINGGVHRAFHAMSARISFVGLEGRLTCEYMFSPRARMPLRIWYREKGSAVPSRGSLLILHAQAGSGGHSRDSSRSPRRRQTIPLQREMVRAGSRGRDSLNLQTMQLSHLICSSCSAMVTIAAACLFWTVVSRSDLIPKYIW